MLAKKVKSRIFYSIIFLIFATLALYITLKSLEENVVYFYSPTEIYNKTSISSNTKIRVGGLVKERSINKIETSMNFIITDLKNELVVSYNGTVPNLFSEGKGVVAEGRLQDKNFFIADRILAKHDEKYMPPELKDLMKKNVN